SGAPRAIISDRGTHFCNDQFTKVMLKYRVTHRLSTAYHPQTSGQERISKQMTKNEAKTTKSDMEWKSKVKTKPKPEKVNPDKSKVKK
ncbi:reverse transcriptase domain-containing protein, partial [Tanacetum coccineum]